MRGVACRHGRSGGAGLLFAVAIALVAFQALGVSQGIGGRGELTGSLTYTRGQPVVPFYSGWKENPDGTFALYFSYLNRNWQEELDIPIGPNNNIQPAPFGPDAGQPTHFLPRVNRWQFAVRVRKDFGSKEVIWTLTAHGQTLRAYGTLSPPYVVDDFTIMFEGGNDERGRKPPTLHVDGDRQRTVKVGQPSPLVGVATAPPIRPPRRGGGDAESASGASRTPVVGPGIVGGDISRKSATGLRFAWFVYRGAGEVTFDPPIPFKVWEDQRGGSPYTLGWRPPPIPPGNKWVHNVTFHEPGTYVLRAQAHDGYQFANHDVTFTVTR